MQSYWFDSSFIQVTPCNYWKTMHQSGKRDCDVSAYFNYYNGLHVCSHQENYFIVKNIKMAQFYKLVFVLGSVYHLAIHEIK